MSTTIEMQCPNEDCCAPYEVEVEQTSPAEKETRDNPGKGADYDIHGPNSCVECTQPLDTRSEYDWALEKAMKVWREGALDRMLERKSA